LRGTVFSRRAGWAPANTRTPRYHCRRSKPGGAVTFERYTEKARRAIFFARYEATNLPTGYIETEHLLLGLLREDVLLRIKLINQKGSSEGLRQELARAIQTRDEQIATSVDLPLSHEAQKVLTRAAEEAEALHHRSIDSGHLVLGVFKMKGKAAEALDHHGIDYQAYREALAASPQTLSESETVAAPEPSPEVVPEAAPLRALAAPSLRETVSKFEQLIDQADSRFAAASEDFQYQRLKRKPWTRKEALGHLIDWATTHHRWFARALTEPKLVAGAYPDDRWVSAQPYSELSWSQLLALWSALNRFLTQVMAAIPEEKLRATCRIGIEPTRSLRELIAAYVAHCEDIIGQMLALG
jgi:hypothetical protein